MKILKMTVFLFFVLLAFDQHSSFPATVPSAPINVQVTAGDGEAIVSFAAPESDGGSPIKSYFVISNPGVITLVATGTSSPITVTGLTKGTVYTFTVMATNEVGTGPASEPSNDITPTETYSDASQWQ